MRQIFKDVPVIYGFSSKAPLGRSAAPVLERYFQTGGAAEVASGRASGKLLTLFAPGFDIAVVVPDTMPALAPAESDGR